MVASGNGDDQYSIRKRYTEISNHGKYGSNVRGVFSKAKPQKMKLTIPNISRTFQTKAIQKSKIKLHQ